MIVIMILGCASLRSSRYASKALKIKHCQFGEFLVTYAFINMIANIALNFMPLIACKVYM
jgi:hypothetical protein